MYNKKAYLQQIEDVIAAGPYSDTWDSLNRYQVPQWFKEAKFGIFIHWGIYSVPAFGSEWYSRNMYIEGSKEFEHHRKTYGDHRDFGYKDFIPMFRAEKFDADAWAELFARTGARYVVPVAEHHDGFQMYKSELSHWNAAEMGPKRDVLGELTKAFGERGLVNGASTHRIEHWFFMGHGRDYESDVTDKEQWGDFYWPAVKEPADHFDSFSEPVPTEEFLEDWMIRTIELIDRYHVKVLYFDWWIHHESARRYLQKIAAYYYNRAAQWGEEVVIAYKHDSFMFGTALVDMERGQFADCKPYYWQTDTAIARNSWCYTEGNDFKKPEVIIRDLVDIVSKNGNLLLNVGPKADGTISEEDRHVLEEIGKWMAVNGEAIYGSKVWKSFGEGPTNVQEGMFTDAVDKVFTREDFRFTVKGGSIYAFSMAYPEDGRLLITSMAKRKENGDHNFIGIIDGVEMLGAEKPICWKHGDNGLEIQGPGMSVNTPVVLKIKMR